MSWEPSWHRRRPERSLDSMELKEKQGQEEVHFNGEKQGRLLGGGGS